MSDAINRAVERQARQIIGIERWLVAFSVACAVALLAAALYFEQTYRVPSYSLAFAATFFLASMACFRGLFRVFGDSFRDRRKRGTRALFMLASLYMVLASVVAYAVAFGLFGLRTPWAGDGREYLYACYFLLSVAVVFLARSATFYWRLRSYITQSLGNLNK
jgi:O-antigen/teichoic acid export membrane protein